MREIEFRGKSLMEGTEGSWLYSSGIKYGDDIELLYCDEETSETWYYVDKETVGQYTGLKDKNGKKIFEGDIVCIIRMDKIIQIKGTIQYSEIYASYIVTKTNSIVDENENLSDYENIKVIGNIYDNPELLEGRR